MTIKKTLIILFSVIALILVSCSSENVNSESYSEGSETTNKGPLATDFDLSDLSGNQVKLSDYEGEKVVLRFWASWCSICLSELDHVNNMTATAEGYKVFTIVTPDINGEQSKDEFITWFESLEFSDTIVLLDETGDIYDAYGVRGYPTTAFIGTDGVLSLVLPGPMSQITVEETLKTIK